MKINKKKVLMVATDYGFLNGFESNDMNILRNMDYEVHAIANIFLNQDSRNGKISTPDIDEIQVIKHTWTCQRKPFSRHNIESYRMLKQLLNKERFDIIHCHTPMGGVLTRIAGAKYRKRGTKILYTAHGFHFYTGAPIINWLIYYPVEFLCSWWTDTLITLNQEDYKRAKKRFHAKKTEYVPGVGIDMKKFAPKISGREKIRKEQGIGEGRMVLLSVGELTEDMNHESVIRAIQDLDITYIIIGKGEMREKLEVVAKEHGIDVRLIGFRNDVADFYDAADIYILPSLCESSNVSIMEAMASSLPCLCDCIKGNTELVDQGKGGYLFEPYRVDEIRSAIEKAIKKKDSMGEYNLQKIRRYDLSAVNDQVDSINRRGYKHLDDVLQRQKKRNEIGVPIDAHLLISVGELSVRKNHKVVVEALQELPDDYWYVVVGQGDLKEFLENIDKTGRLKLLGFRTDIVELLHASDLFVFPSLQEGLPVALMEAMAVGVPVLCSKIRGNTDLTQSVVDANCDWKDRILEGGTIERLPEKFGMENVNCRMREIYGDL